MFASAKVEKLYNIYNKIITYILFLIYICVDMDARNIEIENNYVLIKPDKDYETLKNGLFIGLTATTEARHYAITGKVLIVPNTLVFRGEEANKLRKKTGGNYSQDELRELHSIMNGSMEYKTELEIQVGDKVWFDYLAHINANTEQKMITVDGHGECILVEYSRLFIREREGEVIPINGWIWIKQINRDIDLGSGLELAGSADMHVPNKAEVVKVGKPIQQYLSALHTDHYFNDLKEGDIITFNEKIMTPLEYSLHETDGLEKLYKIKRKDIKAIEGVLI